MFPESKSEFPDEGQGISEYHADLECSIHFETRERLVCRSAKIAGWTGCPSRGAGQEGCKESARRAASSRIRKCLFSCEKSDDVSSAKRAASDLCADASGRYSLNSG